MTRKLAGHRTGFGARQGIAFGLSLLCAISLFVVTAGPALAAPPGAPTDVSATPGDTFATVTWTAPLDTGGFPIDSYTVTSSEGQTATTPDAATLSATVEGLTNGTPYTFTVTAQNTEPIVGPASDPSDPVTPATAPDAPTVGTATWAHPYATVTWSAPAGNGGSPITRYTVTASPGGLTGSANGSALSTTVSGLTNGIEYTFTVTARNAAGESGPSAPSNPITPTGPPSAPTNVTANPGNGSVIVTWDTPANEGGAPVTSYRLTPFQPGGFTDIPARACPPSSSPCYATSVAGLTNGTSYSFAVTATSMHGTGPAGTSAAVTPGTVPGPPTGLTATPGNGTVALTWSAPLGSGGSPVTSYTATARLSGVQVASTEVLSSATQTTISGLDNGTTYSFRVVATNSFGPSAPSTSILATPSEPPVTAANVRSGYWMVESDGRVYRFGDAVLFGDPKAVLGTAQAVDLEPSPSGNGYWVVDDLGRVYGYGDAVSRGNVLGLPAGERAISLSATPSGAGYWIFTTRGKVVPFGDATFHGDMSGVALNGPVRDSIPTTSGRGYYMVASDGGIFAFGDAVFYGSMGATRLNAPVQSLVPDADGVGYWLVAADGGIFAFAAPFRGSMGATPLNQPITGMVRFGNGYLMVGTDGGIFNFSDRPFLGSLGASPPPHPIVSVAALPG